jgi:hypothetical protein
MLLLITLMPDLFCGYYTANSSVQFRHGVRVPGSIVHTQVPGRNTYNKKLKGVPLNTILLLFVESPG